MYLKAKIVKKHLNNKQKSKFFEKKRNKNKSINTKKYKN